MLLQQKSKLAQKTRNNLSHLLPWSLSQGSRTFPTKFVHGFSLAVPLLGLSEGRWRTDQITDTWQRKALQDGSLPSRSTGIASTGKGNASCRLGSAQHSLSRLSPRERCLEQGRQPRLSAVIHNAAEYQTRSTSQQRPKTWFCCWSAEPSERGSEPAGRSLPRGRRKPGTRQQRPRVSQTGRANTACPHCVPQGNQAPNSRHPEWHR